MADQNGDKQMRTMFILGGLCLLAACGGNPNVPPRVTWSYGAGNGDPVSNSSAVKYSFANGLGKDMPVPADQMPTVSHAYGAEGTHGVTEQMVPAAQAPQRVASPTPPTPHPAITPAPSAHL